MLMFEPYPITINGSKKDEVVRAPVVARFKKGEITESQMDDELRRLDANKWDFVADTSPQAVHYEGRVKGLLSYVKSNTLGRCVLDILRTEGSRPVWIVPYDSQDIRWFGDGNAKVGRAPWPYVKKHAVLMKYSFDMFTYTTEWGKDPGSRADEVLFHELVHVCRFANPSVQVKYTPSLPGYEDHEEFLAHQMSNVYRSMRGAKKFLVDYKKKALGTAAECEAALRSSKPLMDVLADFLRNDPLSKRVAKLKTPYNPFADFARLRQP